MKKSVGLAVEASKKLYQALEAGEVEAAGSLASVRDRLIKELPGPSDKDLWPEVIDSECEALLHELQELDNKIQALANGLLDRSSVVSRVKLNSNINQEKINKRYKP